MFFPALEALIPVQDKRYPTFKRALELMTERKAGMIVETGTARHGVSNYDGDGCSTYIFAEWAFHHRSILYSIDIDAKAIAASKSVIQNFLDSVILVHSDSVKYLKQFSQKIDFLYLDSYDFDVKDPLPSQRYHLKEIQAAYPKLTKSSMVMIDDCDLPFGGKGKLAIEYLLKRNWKIVMENYQIILVQQK